MFESLTSDKIDLEDKKQEHYHQTNGLIKNKHTKISLPPAKVTNVILMTTTDAWADSNGTIFMERVDGIQALGRLSIKWYTSYGQITPA